MSWTIKLAALGFLGLGVISFGAVANATDRLLPSQKLSALISGGEVKRATPVPKTRIAAGDECPANSGSFCSDQFPVCCRVSGTWGCYAKLADCKEP